MKHEFKCHICHKDKVHESDSTTGYATNNKNHKICFECCGYEDKAYMVINGKITLYLTTSTGMVISNWPGSYKTHCTHYRKGKHNIARTRTDVWFTGPDGLKWWGVSYGENTQIVHCKRIKG